MSKSKLKPYKDEIIKKRLNGMNIKKLSEEYHVPYSIMRQFLYRNKVSSSDVDNKIFESDEINDIIKNYEEGKPYTKIAKEYGVSAKTIKKILVENGIAIRDVSHSKRIYDVDEFYFDNIDTPNKAYILGMLYADGNVNTSSGHFTISIGLQECDVDILNKIKKELGFSGPLQFKNRNAKNPNLSDMYVLNISNKHMAQCLIEYGVVPNKTLVLSFPSFLTADLIPHFIRGYWDGDGHISIKDYVACCCGNDDYILGLKRNIEHFIGVHCCVSKTRSPSGKILQLRIAGRHNTSKFLNYIYDNADLYMDRKYNYYIQKYCNNSQ